MSFEMGKYDVIVVGGGHAGVEASLAAARLGCKTAMFTISLDQIANLPCNPSIGGTAKGHLVREIDALGGEMGRAADACLIQSRMLNRGKGPAVHSLRAQADRVKYHNYMKRVCELQENLDIKQAEIKEIIVENDVVKGVITSLGAIYYAKTVIISTGTYLRSTIHIGESSYDSGPDAALPAKGLDECLKKHGIELRRFKTGTPCRAHRRSIDFSVLEEQKGDDDIVPFSFETDKSTIKNLVSCYTAYTNEETHRIIKENLHRSPMYSGRIEGIGPRYCPSIEDKVVRFADKERHQIFVEPMGLDTDECYLQGISTSLPEDVQIKFLRTVKGFENIEIMRPAYAIEYECCDPTQLRSTLEFKTIRGLFGAGQFNGTSGYEEAAAQGLVAGINAANLVLGREMLILDRASSYIGTLIDDLVIKGCQDPYRMMTSRSEYRLILRQDNADQRLMPIGYKIGLVSEERYNRLQQKIEEIEQELKRVNRLNIAPSKELNKFLIEKGTSPLSTGCKLSDLIRRPQLDYSTLSQFDVEREEHSDEVCEQINLRIKYDGYIKKQLDHIEYMRKFESKLLPHDLDYTQIRGLRLEAIEKLNKLKPENIGQASRISGVSPADISILVVWLEQKGRQNAS
ncbi:MAG: tRNA uridine-5-carboxymethylaminomethyl(34) synthesis enzyme MnmG [Clostridiales bacterium]|nr:tRNA uridine-5-carboxymethylaminomethyl(34) synthesis enzyme MnmG [Clostridiales bacterium]